MAWGMLKTLALVAVSAVLSLSSALAEGEFRHIVFFRFKADAKPEQIQEVEKAFAELPSKINTITGYEWGKSESIEKLNEGYTHCFFVTFKNKGDCEAYLKHEAHKAFGAKLKGLLDKAFVFDYTAKKD